MLQRLDLRPHDLQLRLDLKQLQVDELRQDLLGPRAAVEASFVVACNYSPHYDDLLEQLSQQLLVDSPRSFNHWPFCKPLDEPYKVSEQAALALPSTNPLSLEQQQVFVEAGLVLAELLPQNEPTALLNSQRRLCQCLQQLHTGRLEHVQRQHLLTREVVCLIVVCRINPASDCLLVLRAKLVKQCLSSSKP